MREAVYLGSRREMQVEKFRRSDGKRRELGSGQVVMCKQWVVALKQGGIEHFREGVASVDSGLGSKVQSVNATAAGRRMSSEQTSEQRHDAAPGGERLSGEYTVELRLFDAEGSRDAGQTCRVGHDGFALSAC
jgi:hypothetical protein